MNIKIWIGDDPELSEKIQKMLFAVGINWDIPIEVVRNVGYPSLFVNDAELTYGTDRGYYDSHKNQEVSFDWLKEETVTITCEGKTVEISRESAKALNLI